MSDKTKDDLAQDTDQSVGPTVNRRGMFRRAVGAAAATAAAAVAVGVRDTAQAAEEPGPTPPAGQPQNPYGGGPNTGITLPPYYRPTPSVANANTFFPGIEELGADEMRISFIGSSPVPPTRAQAGTAIMVELGNGKRFFFDLGPGCLRNIVALQVPLQMVNDIFITHLHIDHYGELPYIYGFSAWMGRWKPLRVTGPSGRTPQDGTKAMIEGMKAMTHWHTDSFNQFPIGDGYEVEVNEFDFRDGNGICYDQDGVVIRHWRRAHGKDGASAYRLDWNGLSFVWTGDGRPDANTAKFAKGVDVFVSELQPDTMNIQAVKFGIPPIMGLVPIDVAHTITRRATCSSRCSRGSRWRRTWPTTKSWSPKWLRACARIGMVFSSSGRRTASSSTSPRRRSGRARRRCRKPQTSRAPRLQRPRNCLI